MQRVGDRRAEYCRHVIARCPGDGLRRTERGDDDRPVGLHPVNLGSISFEGVRAGRSCQASGGVKKTTAATSSIAPGRLIPSPISPYSAGDNAPAPIVPV